MKTIIYTLLLLLSGFAHCDITKGEYAACVSEDLLDEWTSAAAKADNNALLWLLDNGCITTRSGVQISVLERSWGVAKVRAYSDGESYILWTYIENIVSKE